MKNFFYNKKGFTIIEVLVACSIISIITISVMSTATKGIQLSNRSLRQVQASLLLEEGVEAVKSIRDDNWNNISSLSLETNYYLIFDTNTNKWSLVDYQISEIDRIFTRTVVFSEVYRDNNDSISQVGILDNGSKKVEVKVSWLSAGDVVLKKINFYITNIFN